MRSVHLLGLGLVVGATALGAMLATISYRWQLETYPETASAHAAGATTSSAQPQESVSQGKALFTQKCTSCHTIGEGRRVGPDLKGIVAQRPDGWLAEFISTPDRVIARGDAIARQLVQAYGMPMPNLGLSKVQAEAILDYIRVKSEDRSGAQVALASAPVAGHEAAPASGAVSGTPAQQDTSRGKALFDQKCTSCHSIGAGKLVGPDLKGVSAQRPRDWLLDFISAPDRVIASGDPTAAQLVKEFGMPMPNVGVSKAQAEDILAYLEGQEGGGTQPGAAPVGAAAPAPLQAGNAEVGRSLFAGERPLANGGPACIACHNVAGIGALSGGNWGLDLTKAQTRTGAAGLASIMRTPPFPGMKEAFASRPITDQEVADLLAFLAAADAQQAGGPADFTFPLIGLGTLVFFVVLAGFLWRGRMRGVRKPLVGGTTR